MRVIRDRARSASQSCPVPVAVSHGWRVRRASAQLGDLLVFRATAPPGAFPIRQVNLSIATQMDSTVPTACDFVSVPLLKFGSDYFGFVPIGTTMPCGPPVRPDNILYYASAKDWGIATISSKMNYRSSEMEFCSDFAPRIQHFPGDDFPVPPAPGCVCLPKSGS